MFDWHWPWIFLILPLPLVLRWVMPAFRNGITAIRVPFYARLRALQADTGSGSGWRFLGALLLILIWLLLLTAAARPTWIGDPVPLPASGRDLMLAVDISGSMREEDMRVGNSFMQRLTVVKEVVGDFINRREADRVGLILFGERGYLQTPLTFDRNTVRVQLEEALPGFAGNATAIGDAIGLAIKLLRDRPAESRVLVLLTDGANTAGTDPRRAADIAARAGIRIHTIGVGGTTRVERSLLGFTRQVNPSADLDEDTLTYIAETTGGQFFRAHDPAELETIYRYIDELEPAPEEVTYRPQRSLFHWPLAAALGLSLLLGLLQRTLGRGTA